jgi:hypothetical protein
VELAAGKRTMITAVRWTFKSVDPNLSCNSTDLEVRPIGAVTIGAVTIGAVTIGAVTIGAVTIGAQSSSPKTSRRISGSFSA